MAGSEREDRGTNEDTGTKSINWTRRWAGTKPRLGTPWYILMTDSTSMFVAKLILWEFLKSNNLKDEVST